MNITGLPPKGVENDVVVHIYHIQYLICTVFSMFPSFSFLKKKKTQAAYMFHSLFHRRCKLRIHAVDWSIPVCFRLHEGPQRSSIHRECDRKFMINANLAISQTHKR